MSPGRDLVCLDLAFLGQTEVFPGMLREPVPWLGWVRANLGVEGDPCLDSKHRSGPVL